MQSRQLQSKRGKLHLKWRFSICFQLQNLPYVISPNLIPRSETMGLTIHRDAGLSPNARDSL